MAIKGIDAFAREHRRVLGLGAWLVGILLLVGLYNVTRPRPSRSATDGGRQVADGETIQVGALPVT